ncbi:hypothetical protein MXB_1168 [Myxobolus squamalis]|nr:hypothetical protein MXB_1168 [Myxobolus squamalis]
MAGSENPSRPLSTKLSNPTAFSRASAYLCRQPDFYLVSE